MALDKEKAGGCQFWACFHRPGCLFQWKSLATLVAMLSFRDDEELKHPK